MTAATHRLVVVVRADLAPGLRAAQACHAAIDYARAHALTPDHYLVLLETPDLRQLEQLAARAHAGGVPTALFHEPDLGGQLTAVALDAAAEPLYKGLPPLFGRR